MGLGWVVDHVKRANDFVGFGNVDRPLAVQCLFQFLNKMP